MGKVMLDTSVLIALDREPGSALPGVTDADQVVLSVVVLGELLVAANHPGRSEKERHASMVFVNELREASILAGIDDRTAEIFSELRAFTAKSGQPRGSNDLWIAATAVHVGADLVTFDSRAGFHGLPGVRVRS